MKWCGMVHGCMVYTERAEMAAVSCGTSHVIFNTVRQYCNQTTSVDIQKVLLKATLIQNHMQQKRMGLLENGE